MLAQTWFLDYALDNVSSLEMASELQGFSKLCISPASSLSDCLDVERDSEALLVLAKVQEKHCHG